MHSTLSHPDNEGSIRLLVASGPTPAAEVAVARFPFQKPMHGVVGPGLSSKHPTSHFRIPADKLKETVDKSVAQVKAGLWLISGGGEGCLGRTV